MHLPSIHSGYWDEFYDACQETATVVCMHVGSGTKTVTSSSDAPAAVPAAMLFANSAVSMVDLLMSGVLVKFPQLRLMYAECQIGWIPFVLQRADEVWAEHQWAHVGSRVEMPSESYRDRVFSCFFKDAVGVELLEKIGVGQVLFETDYPHNDGTWPHSQKVAAEQLRHLPPASRSKVLAGNAISLFGLSGDIFRLLRCPRRGPGRVPPPKRRATAATGPARLAAGGVLSCPVIGGWLCRSSPRPPLVPRRPAKLGSAAASK